MKILVVGEKKKNVFAYVKALREKGAEAKYLRILKFVLVSKHNKSFIKTTIGLIDKYDAIFIQSRTSLGPFIEPMLEQIEEKKIYSNCKIGSYYNSLNEPLQNVTLTTNGISCPNSIITGNEKNIEKIIERLNFPILAKSIKGKEIQQSMIVNTPSELNVFIKSMKHEMDGYLFKEFIKGRIISCLVIGNKVFAIEQTKENNDSQKINLMKGKTYRVRDDEKEIVISAANAIGYDIAQVDIINKKVISVSPIIPLQEFNKICSENIEKYVADFLIEKVKLQGEKKSYKDDLKKIRKAFSKTLFGRLFSKKKKTVIE
ncbi:MAG: hypothetical protein PHQ98_04030 [Candidatus ainarchaeum sp.]|nr:hypothetical protein [Candidatus ainarchaeum sp.]